MVSGSRYLTDDRTGVKWAKLGVVVFTALLGAITGFWITVVESYVQYQIWAINGLGSFLEGLVSDILGGGAGLVVASWRAAAVQAVEAGPGAPILLALEAIVILTIAYAIWTRRPYA